MRIKRKQYQAKPKTLKPTSQDCQAAENSKLHESEGRKAMDLKQVKLPRQPGFPQIAKPVKTGDAKSWV
jgi:hypothetical protein